MIMEFNATVDLIIKEIKEAVEIIDDLKNCQGVPLLQLELAKSKCKNAADVIRLLKNTPDLPPVPKNEPEIRSFPEIKIAPVQASRKKMTSGQITEIKKPEISVQKETTQTENVTGKEEIRKISGKKSDKAILADKFGQRTDSLNERLGGHKEDEGVRDIIKSKPITSLSEAIGINDKFLFIRELFNGNADLYYKTISNLENTGSFTHARTIIMNYAGNDTGNEAARQLIELVKRKFPTDE